MDLEKKQRKEEYEENLDKIAGIKNTKSSKLINLENELDNLKKVCGDFIVVSEYSNPNSETLKNVKNKINEKRESIDSLLEEFIEYDLNKIIERFKNAPNGVVIQIPSPIDYGIEE